MKKRYQDVPEEAVSAQPVKSFFVEMLTRDIGLTDSILDLLDNCMDGIVRSVDKRTLGRARPYEGYGADINLTKESFEIADNCGGIPWDLHEYAFRMGRARPNNEHTRPTVGTYGIGMKRALFKIGRHATIQTQNDLFAYEVEISPDWLDSPDDWTLPVHSLERTDEDGTLICIDQLNDDVRAAFSRTVFERVLRAKIETHYALIIAKGFTVRLNGRDVEPRPLTLRFDDTTSKNQIRPYIYKGNIDGVDVFLAAGFTRPFPPAHELEADVEKVRYSSSDAGWTVICNDRVVLYCDKTELTGWGTAGIPQYHNQFISIAGMVEFHCNDASKLPTTTTKRGIDASSHLYLRVQDKMREGLRMFTGFTNRWKGKDRVKEARERIQDAQSMSLPDLKARTSKLKMSSVAKLPGSQYRPPLPTPKKERSTARIGFVKPRVEVETVSEYLFDTTRMKPSDVGQRCFEIILDEARV